MNRVDETERRLEEQTTAALARVGGLAIAAFAREIDAIQRRRQPLGVRVLRGAARGLRRIAEHMENAADRIHSEPHLRAVESDADDGF